MLTPNDLEILIHYYVSDDIHPRAGAPAVKEAVERFQRDGVLDEELCVTAKGRAWLEAILSVPMPVEPRPSVEVIRWAAFGADHVLLCISNDEAEARSVAAAGNGYVVMLTGVLPTPTRHREYLGTARTLGRFRNVPGTSECYAEWVSYE